jgi:hypothetical protein
MENPTAVTDLTITQTGEDGTVYLTDLLIHQISSKQMVKVLLRDRTRA